MSMNHRHQIEEHRRMLAKETTSLPHHTTRTTRSGRRQRCLSIKMKLLMTFAVISVFVILQVKQHSVLVNLSNNSSNTHDAHVSIEGKGEYHHVDYPLSLFLAENKTTTTTMKTLRSPSNINSVVLKSRDTPASSPPAMATPETSVKSTTTTTKTTLAPNKLLFKMSNNLSSSTTTPQNTTRGISDWTDQHTHIFESILNNRRQSNSSNDLKKYNSLFPPRLPLPAQHDPLGTNNNNGTTTTTSAAVIDPLTHGVFFAGTGDMGFLERRIVPALEHLIRGLKIPRAKERAKIRQEYRGQEREQRNSTDSSNTTTSQSSSSRSLVIANTGFALLASREFCESPLLRPVLDFFDIVYHHDQDLPDWPKDWRQTLQTGKPQGTRGHAKAVKVHAMASSPFDITVFMDFDNFPCRADFMGPLLSIFSNNNNNNYNNNDNPNEDSGPGGTDIAMSNKYVEMNDIPKTSNEHWMAEHNTAMVILNMTSATVRELLGLYVHAFHATWEVHPASARVPPRDQPAFMIALRALRQLHDEDGEERRRRGIDNKNDRMVFLNHVDLPHDFFCRRLTTPEGQPLVCGGTSTCLFAHKPDRIEELGRRRRGSFA